MSIKTTLKLTALSALTALADTSQAQAEGKLTVYCSVQNVVCEKVTQAFSKKYNVDAQFVRNSTGVVLGKIKAEKESLMILNIYLMFCGILLLFCRSSDGGRIAWYCTIGPMIILSDFCLSSSARFLRFIVSLMMFVLYFRIINAWGFLLLPYKTFFSEGYRQGDVIRDRYEYDFNYDTDKFYNINFEKRNR